MTHEELRQYIEMRMSSLTTRVGFLESVVYGGLSVCLVGVLVKVLQHVGVN